MPRKASSKPADSTATIGFEATAMRGSATIPRGAKMRCPQRDQGLAADSPSEA